MAKAVRPVVARICQQLLAAKQASPAAAQHSTTPSFMSTSTAPAPRTPKGWPAAQLGSQDPLLPLPRPPCQKSPASAHSGSGTWRSKLQGQGVAGAPPPSPQRCVVPLPAARPHPATWARPHRRPSASMP